MLQCTVWTISISISTSISIVIVVSISTFIFILYKELYNIYLAYTIIFLMFQTNLNGLTSFSILGRQDAGEILSHGVSPKLSSKLLAIESSLIYPTITWWFSLCQVTGGHPNLEKTPFEKGRQTINNQKQPYPFPVPVEGWQKMCTSKPWNHPIWFHARFWFQVYQSPLCWVVQIQQQHYPRAMLKLWWGQATSHDHWSPVEGIILQAGVGVHMFTWFVCRSGVPLKWFIQLGKGWLTSPWIWLICRVFPTCFTKHPLVKLQKTVPSRHTGKRHRSQSFRSQSFLPSP